MLEDLIINLSVLKRRAEFSAYDDDQLLYAAIELTKMDHLDDNVTYLYESFKNELVEIKQSLDGISEEVHNLI